LSNASSISNSGTYFIVNETNLGCKVILPVVVEIYSKPLANFAPSPSILNTYNLTSTMNNNSIDAVSYEWYFMDGGTSKLDNPTHEFPDRTYGDQNILLIATSAEGCKDTTIKAITIEEELIIYIPNTFTPDIDIFNPTFQPVFTSGHDPYFYTLLIFDRWGEIIFESHDASIGWDGTFGDKKKSQDGIYTWKIEFKLSKKDEHRMLVGSVNLVR
jgi:gliding motility-associated-like protein